jgi:hypothetical protein
MIGAAPKIRLPYPHAGQRAVLRQMRRFTWLVAGRRWRKTTLQMAYTVERALEGQHIVWGAPTFDQVRVGFEEAKRAAYGVATFNESRMTARFPGDGVVRYRSLDNPDNARGHTADGVVIDEAGDVVPVAWREVLRPMLIDTNGWLFAGGTPKGFNWLYQEFELAKLRDDSVAIQAPTRGYRIDEAGHVHPEPHPLENPSIAWDEIAQLWAATCPLLPDGTRDISGAYVFHQEIGAQFNAVPGGQVFPTWSGPTEEADFIPDGGPVLWGVDDGYVGTVDPTTGHYTADSHPRVFLLAQQRGNGQLAIFAESYAVGRREDHHIAEVKALGYPDPDYAAVDKSAAALKRWLHDAGVYTRNSPGDVEESVKEIRSAFAPDDNGFRRVIVHPRCVHLCWELANYRRDEATRKIIKAFDHGPDAARYLFWTKRYG